MNGRSSWLGELVRGRRRDLDLQQAVLADRAGLSLRGLRDIEAGRVSRPRAESMRRLAEALMLQPDQFVEAVDDALLPTGAELRITALGPLLVRFGDVDARIGSEHQRLLLGLLVLNANHVVSLDEIVEHLWTQGPPTTYRAMLQTHLARLRRLLGGPAGEVRITWAGSGYVLEAGPAQLDVLEFDERVLNGTAAWLAGNRGRAMSELGSALDLWHGPAIAGVGGLLDNHPSAIALSRRRAAICVTYAEVAMAAGDHREAARRLRAVAHADPFDEVVHELLMRALAGAGRRAEALAVFTDLRDQMVEQLGIEPGEQLRQAYMDVLADTGPHRSVAIAS